MLDENLVTELARRGIVADTFRRLTPDKKDRIYRAAVRLFGEYGYDGLTVGELCHEAGISKGSFFQYFPSKSHLLEFAILILDNRLAKWMTELAKNERSSLTRDRLLYLYEELVADSGLSREEQLFYLFVTGAIRHAAVKLEGMDLERHMRDYVTRIISRGEQTGEIRGDIQDELSGHLVSLIIGAVVEREYAGEGVAHRNVPDCLMSILFDGIRA